MSRRRDLATLARVGVRHRLWRGTVRGRAAVLLALARGRRDLFVTQEQHALDRPQQLAIDDGRTAMTWSTFHREVLRTAGGLHRLGLRPGDRLAIAIDNSVAWFVTAGAAAHLGAVPAPMSPHSGPAEVIERCRRCRLAVVAPRLREAAVVGLGDAWRAITSLEALPEGAPPRRALAPIEGRADLVLFTSGTTGRSKGTRLSTRDMHPVTAFRYLDALDIGPYTVLHTPCPLYHAAPLLVTGLTLLLGGAVIIDRRFEDDQIAERLRTTGATHTFLVPALLERLARLPDAHLRSLRAGPLSAVISGGSLLPADLKKRLARALGPVLYDTYGATEIGLVAIGRPSDNATRPSAVGPVLPGVSTRIMNEHGSPVPPGGVGELHVRTDTLALGYDGMATDDPERWAPTGDLARIDSSGFIEIVGRIRDIVISGGVNLFPTEIEEALQAHPEVREAVVAGIPDARWGEALHAWIIPEDGRRPSGTALTACVREQLAAYKAPRAYHFVSAIPRTPSGKVLRRVLVSDYIEGAAPAP